MKTDVEIDEKIKKDFKAYIENQLKIVSLFNSLLKETFPDDHKKLKIEEDEKLIIFDLLQYRIKSLELTAYENSNTSEEILTINVFKALFMGNKGLNLEDLDIKIKYFLLTLKLLKDENMSISDLKIANYLRKEIKESVLHFLFKKFNNTIFDNEIYYIFCLSLIFKYMKSNSIFVDSFIAYVKKEFKIQNNGCELELRKDFRDEDIEKISKECLINN